MVDLSDFTAGILASFTSQALFYPLDTISTSIQLKIDKPKTLMECYKGFGASLFTGIPVSTLSNIFGEFGASLASYLRFVLFPQSKKKSTLLSEVGKGAMKAVFAELACTAIYSPLEVVKTKLLIDKSTNIYGGFKSYFTEKGVGGYLEDCYDGFLAYCPLMVLDYSLSAAIKYMIQKDKMKKLGKIALKYAHMSSKERARFRKMAKFVAFAGDIMIEATSTMVSCMLTSPLENAFMTRQSLIQSGSTIFAEYSSPSSIKANRGVFRILFECLSLFVKHTYCPSSDVSSHISTCSVSATSSRGGNLIFLDDVSLNELFDALFSPMIRVEAVLSLSNEEGDDQIHGVCSITILLFRIANVFLTRSYILDESIFSQISPLLSKVFTIGQSMHFDDDFVGDIIGISVLFSLLDSTKDSLLSLLLPHIMPWMKKYPEKRFVVMWITILKKLSCDNDSIKPHLDRSAKLWFMFHPILD
ncbi:hypothetical protein ADUPG1_011784, partial [Aduncisulcus paluster]